MVNGSLMTSKQNLKIKVTHRKRTKKKNVPYFLLSSAVCIAGELSVNIKDSSSYMRVIKELHDDEKYRFVVGVVIFAQEDSVR